MLLAFEFVYRIYCVSKLVKYYEFTLSKRIIYFIIDIAYKQHNYAYNNRNIYKEIYTCVYQ